MAPQLTGTNGPRLRREPRWTRRASSSLPVPLSPPIQHAEIRLRGAIRLRERLEERGGSAEDRGLAGLRGSARERAQRERVPHLDDHLGQAERFGHEAEGARARGAHGCVDRCVRP
jgi:hypothetical protein